MYALSIADILSRVESEATKIGSIGINFLQKTARFLSDPKKGIPLAISVVKLASFAKADPSVAVKPISDFGEWLMSYDPANIIGQPPQGPFYIDWNAINGILPDLQCGPLDMGCFIQNGLRALGRATLGALYGIGNTIYWALWNVAYWLLKAVMYLAGWVLKYVVANIISALVSFVNTVLDGIKTMMCVYVTYVSPFLVMYDGFRQMTSGRRYVGVMEMVFGILPPIAIVAQDCGITVPVFPTAPSVTVPAPSPVYNVPPRFAYPYVSVSVADSFTAKPLLKTLMMTDTVNVKDGGVI